DYLRLGEQVADAERGGADRFHIDVMDGLFVPNLSMGIPIVEAMRRGTKLPLEIHLMIERPERDTTDFIKAGGDVRLLHQRDPPEPPAGDPAGPPARQAGGGGAQPRDSARNRRGGHRGPGSPAPDDGEPRFRWAEVHPPGPVQADPGARAHPAAQPGLRTGGG